MDCAFSQLSSLPAHVFRVADCRRRQGEGGAGAVAVVAITTAVAGGVRRRHQQASGQASTGRQARQDWPLTCSARPYEKVRAQGELGQASCSACRLSVLSSSLMPPAAVTAGTAGATVRNSSRQQCQHSVTHTERNQQAAPCAAELVAPAYPAQPSQPASHPPERK